MNKNDLTALRLAVVIARMDFVTRRQIDDKLYERNEPWEAVARFCAGLCQEQDLQSSPHQFPPSEISPREIKKILAAGPRDNQYETALLLQQMRQAKISQFHPEPTRALATAERREALRAQRRAS